MSEVVKLITCLIIVYVETGGIVQLLETIDKQIIQQPMDTLKVCVPSFVYVIQNNLLYVSASHLDAATYQVCSSSSTSLMIPDFFLSPGYISTQNPHYGNVRRAHIKKRTAQNPMDLFSYVSRRRRPRAIGAVKWIFARTLRSGTESTNRIHGSSFRVRALRIRGNFLRKNAQRQRHYRLDEERPIKRMFHTIRATVVFCLRRRHYF